MFEERKWSFYSRTKQRVVPWGVTDERIFLEPSGKMKFNDETTHCHVCNFWWYSRSKIQHPAMLVVKPLVNAGGLNTVLNNAYQNGFNWQMIRYISQWSQYYRRGGIIMHLTELETPNECSQIFPVVLPVPGKVLHNSWLSHVNQSTHRVMFQNISEWCFNTPAKWRFCLLNVGGSSVSKSNLF